MIRHLRFEITVLDIQAGEPSCPSRCPAALALQRAIDGEGLDMTAYVIGELVHLRPAGERKGFFVWSPDGLAKWLEAFDRGCGMYPEAFILDLEDIAEEFQWTR